MLDWDQGGYCSVAPTATYQTSRRYLPDTLVLETTFSTSTVRARLIDCTAPRAHGGQRSHRLLIGILGSIEGEVTFRCEAVPRFDYGAVKPWIRSRKHRIGRFDQVAIGGNAGLLIAGDIPMEMRSAHDLEGVCGIGVRWARERDAVRGAIETQGYDPDRGVFVQAFDSQIPDAALLLLPMAGFIEFDDPRMLRTTDFVRKS